MSKIKRRQTPTHSRSTTTTRGRLILITALLVTACGQTSFSADEHLAQAKQAYAEGNLRTAIIEVKNALQQEPSLTEARMLLGEYSLDRGNGAEAEAELVRARELGADPAQLHIPLLRAWLLQGKNDQVIAATEPGNAPQTLADDAERTREFTLRAQALLAEAQTDAARATLEQALDLQPTDAEALLGMAWVEWLDTNPSEARGYLQSALDSDPQFDRALELLGDIEREAGQLEAAEAAYTKALEASNQPFSPRIKRALMRVMQADYDGAEQDLETLQKQIEEHPALSYLSGLIAFNQQEFERARPYFQEALSRDPDYMPAVFYLGATQYALDNWQQAVSYLNRYVSRVPNAPEAQRMLALARLQDGDSERAEQILNTVLERDPQDQATLAMVSNLYLAQGRTDEALHHLRQVIAIEPESASSRAQLGLALVQDGQREAGFDELQRALELAPEGNPRLEVAIILEHLRANEFPQALNAIDRFAQRGNADPTLVQNLRGVTYAGMGNAEEAETAFRKGLELDSAQQQPGLVTNLARFLAKEGRIEEAQQIAQETLEQFPQNLGLLMTLAQLQVADDDLPASQETLKRAIAADPQALLPRLALARMQLQDDRNEDALETLQPAEADHGESTDWLRLMTLVAERTGDKPTAIEMLTRLKQQQPEAADVHFALGRLLAETGNNQEALTTLEQGLALQPDHLGARLATVQLLVAEGNLEQASTVLEPAVANNPENTQILAQAGLLAAQQGRYAEAVSAFERAVALNPEDRSLHGALAQAQWRAGEQEATLATLSQWLDQHPDDHDFRIMLATSELTRGNEDDAIPQFRQVLDAQPDNVIALNNLAWLLRTEETEQALEWARQAAQLQPESAPIQDTLGVILLEKGETAEAVTVLREAARLADGAPAIALNLARALAENGDTEEAKTQLQAILDGSPSASLREEAEQLLETF